MGRRNLFPGRLNGSRTAQILPESPGRQCPTTEPGAAACEGVIETPGALAKPGSLLRRPMRTETPAGPSAKNQTKNRSPQVSLILMGAGVNAGGMQIHNHGQMSAEGILRLERPAQACTAGPVPLRGRHRRADGGSAEVNKENPRGQWVE